MALFRSVENSRTFTFSILVNFTALTCSRAVFENEIGWLVWLQKVNIDSSQTHIKLIGQDINKPSCYYLIYRLGLFHILTQHRPPTSMFPVSKTNKQRTESVIQDTRGKNVKNVSVENLSCNDILYDLIKQVEFCFKRCPRTAQCL